MREDMLKAIYEATLPWKDSDCTKTRAELVNSLVHIAACIATASVNLPYSEAQSIHVDTMRFWKDRLRLARIEQN